MWCINERKRITEHTKAFEENGNNTPCLRQSVSVIENGIVISNSYIKSKVYRRRNSFVHV